MKKVEVVIIGGGPAGISAAIWCERLKMNHLLLERKDELGGQLDQIYNDIIDYPGFTIGQGKELKKQLVEHFNHMNCSVLTNVKVHHIDVDQKEISIQREDENFEKINYQFLILATGASQRPLGVPGEMDMVARGEVYSASKSSYLFSGKHVIVVGGGDRALEGALLLAENDAKVTVINRSDSLRARSEFLTPAVNHENIEVIYNSEVIEIVGKSKVEGVKVKTKKEPPIFMEAEAVFIRIGIKPNSEIVAPYIELDENGYIETDSHGKSSIDSIYAVGDVCTKPFFSSISSSVGQGMRVVKYIYSLLNKQ
ncbi:NAD(P)/FAD-dependent oxidoreductase [Bacillus timonensis]|nr:NAD(P)/FAD-dependent oxidoreductase [Bacillus timonensis]